MILDNTMLIYLTIDDPYNLHHVCAFSSPVLADAYIAVNGGEVEVLIVDQYQGCHEYRLYKVEYELISGKQVTESWDDSRSPGPPTIPAPKTYTPGDTHVTTMVNGHIVDQGFRPNLPRCRGYGLTLNHAKQAAQSARNRSLAIQD